MGLRMKHIEPKIEHSFVIEDDIELVPCVKHVTDTVMN